MFAGDAGVEITLVSRDNFFLFTPMLHEVAASDLDITHIVSPLRTLLKRTQIFIGDVDAVDLERRRVDVSHGFERHGHSLPYDELVIALGSITNFYGLPGLEQRALTMKTLGDAIHLRNRVIATLEEGDTECAAGRDGLLTFVVAGGGFAGVETIAGLNDFVREALAFYPRLTPERIRMVLVHSGPTILPELGEALGGYAQQKLRARGIEIVTEARVSGVTDAAVLLAGGRAISSRVGGWAGRPAPPPLLLHLPRLLRRRLRCFTICRVCSIAAGGASTSRSPGPAGRACGRSATARSFPTAAPAGLVRRRHNTRCARPRRLPRTSRRRSPAGRPGRSIS